MVRKLLVLGMAAALAGCVGLPGSKAPVETIRYVTGPCLGPCPVYVVTAASDGIGVYDGRQNVLVTGKRTFAMSQAEWEAFKAALQPYRPTGNMEYRGANCTTIATDLPSVEVAWGGDGQQDILHADFGCDMEKNQAMYNALAAAPRHLPIDIFVGRR
ncbi:DUF6438 domain-containing protein [Sphingomicrobium clamense]|uniref:DUF6438 domain-containing protein n=1 Tax=Sphingomicrobium clamense TaxID=2851013 RepID=A0ABS6V6T4_9SPHN|nr:DUF6438 domain-containing protein [Sphingomicrobium sp. B8]MBW0144773.1 hypothetical protein [Sphingomicrobium sp. B8]